MSNKTPEFGPTQRLQRSYESGIRQITKRILAPRKPGQSFEQWIAMLVGRSKQPDVQKAAKLLASRMVASVAKTNYRTWREAAAKSSKAQQLFKYLQNEMVGPTGARVHTIVRENAELISSLPIEAAQRVTEEITKATQAGARPETIAKMYRQRFPQLLRSRVNLISRTETAKASSALTQARCERLNIEWYQWETATDKRTRASHKNMHKVVVPWSQAPSPELLIGEPTQGHYHAGEIYNCRCVVLPLLTLDDIHFPARVYWQGKVTTMTKQGFRKIAVGLEERQAA